VALGWHVITSPDRSVVWHNGATGGYRTMMAFDSKAGVGVVVLSNTANQTGVDDIALHLIAGVPLVSPRAEHHEITVDPAALKGFVGRYQVAPQAVAEMMLDGGQLYTQLTGQPRFPVFMEAPHRGFLKVVEATIDFDVDAKGQATAITIHQNGRDTRAPRIP
jgi:CubicO group peptidase (beta-lactamase class C family)